MSRLSVFTRAPLALAGAFLALPAGAPAGAQYFGRNKVQYETFDFRILNTRHFDIHFYPAESLATADAGRMAERWYVRHSATLRHTFDKKPIIFYANHPDFQQTNVIGGFISQGTGGVTESIRNRVVMPFTGVYRDNDHVLGHELVHVFQYDIASGANGGRGLNALPLWLIEGMAEYLSIGRDDPHTAMWLRDAALRNDLPSIKQLTRDQRYFPYRYGQALWAYIGGRWGDDMVTNLYRASLRSGWDNAVRRTLGITSDSLSKQWLAAVRETYVPLMQGRARPAEAGERVLRRTSEAGDMDVSPVLSPDGRYVAFFTRRGLFDIDLYVADASTGRIVKKLTGPNTDNHFDALSFINAAGSWSPDGEKFAFTVFAAGDNEIAIYDVGREREERRFNVRGVGEITHVAWGPDNQLAFSGSAGGISDLYVLDMATQQLRQLTSDRYADLQPAWSPDGRTLAFATDRGPATDFQLLTYVPMRLALIDVATAQLRTVPVFEGVKHINPQFSPDGRDLYFVAAREGFNDVYRLDLASGQPFQVTRLATGVSGITALSPALSVASRSGRVMFSVFDNAGYSLYRREAGGARGEPVTTTGQQGVAVAGLLPPVNARGLVGAYLADAVTGLPPAGPAVAVEPPGFRITEYRPSLSLEYLGTPGVGIAVGGPRGTSFGGGVAAYFADMLNDRVVGATLQATGSLQDMGGQLFYLNQRRRWHWMLAGSHIPYLLGQGYYTDTTFGSGASAVPGVLYNQVLQRVFLDQASVITQYPFSQSRRFEAAATYTYQWYDFAIERFAVVGNQVQQLRTENPPAPPGLGYAQASAALVGDYSVFGFTSPVAGGRWRLEAAPTFGSINFATLLADYRRYFFARPFTLAFRGLHYGRYGGGGESDRLTPLYLGQPTLIRGYDANSIARSDCARASSAVRDCPPLDRLVGSRIGVLNAELRLPLFGSDEFGVFNVPFLPTELSPFFDAGVAWTGDEAPQLEFSRESMERVPVFSAGLSARLNLLGYAVVEAFYAYPFQRPNEGWQFGFQLAPGW